MCDMQTELGVKNMSDLAIIETREKINQKISISKIKRILKI